VVDVPLLRQRAALERGSGARSPASLSAPTADRPTDATAGDAQRTVALVIGGIGVAAIAAGTVLAVQAQRKNDASLNYCADDQNRCSSRGKDLRDQALDYAHASTAVFAAGGALAVAALVVHVSSPSPPRATKAPLAVHASIDGTGGQLRLSGAF
jgi:ferredoxin-NADP reductase